ncbi:unnamed protein product [Peronospora belbahrii]|uniref:DAGKc domain-containing protein n=1 Tax=Peronospora belbahrii TaxID=622444 RepID=A0ABN8CUV7_9STRA|nr:unnamed protein product [Peronospora belbahrii]
MTVLLTHEREDEPDTGPVKPIDDKNQVLEVMEAAPAHDDDGGIPVKTKRLSGTTTTSSGEEVLTGKEKDCNHERLVNGATDGSVPSPATNHFRRAMTVAVPTKRVRYKQETPENDEDQGCETSETLRSKSWAGCPRDAALEAIENRQLRFRYSTAASAREMVREMHSHRIQEFPAECVMTALVEMQVGSIWRKMRVEVDRDGINCQRVSVFRKEVKEIHIAKDDLIAAALTFGKKNSVDVHFMLPGRGKQHRRLLRRYRTVTLRFDDETTASKLVASLQLFVKWMARVPENVTRRIKVVVNPYSGRRRGRQIWEHWKPLLELANIQCDVEETKYSGHARDIGATFNLKMKYEAIVFVGGDGTVNEFMNGVFTQEESVWRTLVATTPVSLLCAGTDNAFGKGVGTPTHAASVFCIIKRKIRPLDVMTCQASNKDGTTRLEFACTGVSYGVGSDIAVESEVTRWLGVHRYVYLKIKRGLIVPHRHEAKISYVLSDNTPVDPETDPTTKLWNGNAESIFHPAREEKYAGQWQSFSEELTTVGGSNVYFETKYAHPSDGNFDLVYSLKGNIKQTAEITVRYLSNTFLKSELVGYHKVKAMVIEPLVEDVLNVDGEVFPGPGPFRVEVVPQLLCVLSEK